MRATRNATKNTPPPAKKVGKTTTPAKVSTLEKQEQDPKPEPILIVEEETVSEIVTVEIKEESVGTAADANGADAAEKPTETPKTKPAAAKKKVASLKEEAKVALAEEDLEMKEEAGEEGAEEEGQGEGTENDEDGENEEEEDNAEEDGEEEEDGEGVEGDGEEELLEQRPVTASQKRKKLEVFVGGLDKDATEDDVKAAFAVVGEVVEIRLMVNPQTGKNKGYAFVRFANVDQAKRAATELERTKILEKECAVVPSEDNDTLFVGNICKTWKSEQVLEKLQEYGVEGIEETSLMDDPQNEGSNRGFAFLEFATHTDAVKAFKRLCKPDAILGSDRSAKVAWAEPFGEPDEEVMAKVKSVFIDGMPSSWDEAKVKEHFGKFGDVERVVLSKNMPRSKRKDFGFVNYATREAAVACVEALKDAELPDGEDKVSVTVALAKPAPRKKHMKGSRGGFIVGGGRPSGKGKGEGRGTRGGRFGSKRGKGGKGVPRGGKKVPGEASAPKIVKEIQQKGGDKKPVREEKSKDKNASGARGARKTARGGATRLSRFAARGGYSKPSRPSNEFSSQRGRGRAARRGGAAYQEDYMPRGARTSPGLSRPRGYSRPLPREETYPRRLDRAYGRDMDIGYGSVVNEYAEAGPGIKRPFSVLGEESAYYESGRRGYPRARIDYADHGPVGGSHYTESIRAPLGRSSLVGRSTLSAAGGSLVNTGSSALYGSGGSGYSSVLSGGGDYISGAGELRGGSYSSLYGSRTGAGYGLPGGGAGSYY